MSYKNYEANGYMHVLGLLIISHFLRVSYPTRSGWQREKYPNNTCLPWHIHWFQMCWTKAWKCMLPKWFYNWESSGAFGGAGSSPKRRAVSYSAMAARAFESGVEHQSVSYGMTWTLMSSPLSLRPVSCPCKESITCTYPPPEKFNQINIITIHLESP